jgi:heat shock protein HslJ
MATGATPLEKTDWKLVWLPGTKIESVTPRQAPYIELDSASHRMSGSGGCNRLVGGYELEGDHLKFTGSARTMMACRRMETEDALVKALDEVREWKVSGTTLSLLDANGHAVAKFVATQ